MTVSSIARFENLCGLFCAPFDLRADALQHVGAVAAGFGGTVFRTILLSGFGFIGLCLAVAGIYGALTCFARWRTRE